MRIRHALAVGSIVLVACSASGGDGVGTAVAPAPAATSDAGAPFLSFRIDGEAFSIPAEQISTSYQVDGTLKIFAGDYRALGLVITVPDLAACPCRVPAGAVDADSPINQGSVSLQNHPDPGNTLNSWYVGQPGVPNADAVVVTDLGQVHDGQRLISGEFRTRVLRTESNGDGAGNRDYELTDGRFRVAHAVHGGNAF
jgi:hypothetical protein